MRPARSEPGERAEALASRHRSSWHDFKHVCARVVPSVAYLHACLRMFPCAHVATSVPTFAPAGAAGATGGRHALASDRYALVVKQGAFVRRLMK